MSEQRSPDVVREALTTGSGYVVKSCAPRELLPAIKTVLEGGRFVSASVQGQKLTDSKIELEPSKAKIVENRHELNCYPDQATFVAGFARFVGTTLENGSAIVVLARESHRLGIVQKLKS